MRTLSGICFVLALLAAGCSRPRPLDYTVRIDPAFVPYHAEAVIAAIDAWRAAVPQLRVDVAIGPCERGDLCVVDDVGYDSSPSETFEGFCEAVPGGGATIKIYTSTIIEGMVGTGTTETSGHRIQRVAEHELGHAFGLHHSGAGNVMAPSIDGVADAPTAGDVEAFWGAY